MSNRYCNIDGSQAIKTNYDNIEDGFDLVESEMDAESSARTSVNTRVANHVDGTTEKHDDADINNTSEATGSSVKAALNALKSLIDAMVAGDSNASIGLYQINGSGSDTITGTYTDLTYFTDMMLLVTIDGTNETETPTFNLNSLGAKSIKTMDRSGTKVDLRPGAMPAKALLVYDGADLILLNGVCLAYSTDTTLYGEISDLLTTAFSGTFKKLELWGQTLVNNATNGNFADGSTGWTTWGSGITITTAGAEFNSSGDAAIGIIGSMNTVDKYFIATYISDYTSGDLMPANQAPGFGITDAGYYGRKINPTTTADILDNTADYPTVLTVKEVFAINLTAMGTDANGVAYEDYTEATLLELVRAGYFEGMSHTMAQCVESVNENLFSNTINDWEVGDVNGANGADFADITKLRNKYIDIKSNTQYQLSIGSSYVIVACYEYDKYGNYIGAASLTSGNFTSSTTTGQVRSVVRRSDSGTVSLSEVETFEAKIEQNTSATDYKQHNKTQAFINEVLRSTPSVSDSLDILRGVKVERCEEYTLESGDITALATSDVNVDRVTISPPADASSPEYVSVADHILGSYSPLAGVSTGYDNADYIGKSLRTSYLSATAITLLVAKGTYATLGDAQTALAGEKLTYAKDPAYYTTKQLKPQPVQSYNKGTLYKTRKTTMVGLFESGFLIEDDTLPISSITKARLIDTQTGNETYVDPSIITVASDGLSVTAITDATNGQYYWLEYIYIANSTPGLLNYEHSQNEFSQVEQNSFGLARLQDRMSSLETKPNIKTVSIYINTTGYGSFSTANIFEPGRDIEVVGAKVFALDITGVTGATTWTVRLVDSGANYIAALTKTANPSGPEELTLDKDYTKIASDGHIGFSLTKNAAVSDGQYNIIIDYIER